MLISRNDLLLIKNIISKKIEQVFDINTQYKFLLLNQKIESELAIAREQISFILDKYAEKDENGDFIFTNSGDIKIKEELSRQYEDEISSLYAFQVTVPDIYFSLDELKDLQLTLRELMALQNLIKETF